MKCSDKLFYSWVKSQSKDTFNEHLYHVILNNFKQFSCASKYLLIRDSWVNIMPLLAIDNLKKAYKS
jgi:hypothetical protein